MTLYTKLCLLTVAVALSACGGMSEPKTMSRDNAWGLQTYSAELRIAPLRDHGSSSKATPTGPLPPPLN